MKKHLFRVILCGLAVMATARAQLAGDIPANTTAAKPAEPAPVQFEIIESRKIDLGNRSAIYNRVAPPLLPAKPPSEPPPVPPSLTAEQLLALEQSQPAPKKNVALFFSATVYDREITQLTWADERGFHRAFSNLDFNYFGRPMFETADTSYFMMMGLVNQTRDRAVASNVQLPGLAQFSRTLSQYIVVQDDAKPPTEQSLKWLDDLHNYFDANKQQMIDGYNKSVADQIARQQWLKEHPPVPQNTVINFWRVNSTDDTTAAKGGQR